LRPVRNLFQHKTLETDLLDDTPLILGEVIQSAHNRLEIVRAREMASVGSRLIRPLIVVSPELEIPPAIEAPVVSVLKYPGFHAATARIELSRIPIHLQEHFLHQVLGLSGIPQDPARHAENLPIVAVEKHSQGIRNTTSKLLHKMLVGCTLQLDTDPP